jgi:hypothetical protein
VPSLLAVLVATVVGPPPPAVPSLIAHDLATLTDAEARQLAGRRRGQTTGDRVCDTLPC